MKTLVGSEDFARLDELRKIMINARAAFHGLAEDVRLVAACCPPPHDEPVITMKLHLAVAVGVYVRSVGRYQAEREVVVGKLAGDDPRRALLGVEVTRS